MAKARCINFFGHTWGPWKKKSAGQIVSTVRATNEKIGTTGTFLEQERICQHCGYTEINNQTLDNTKI